MANHTSQEIRPATDEQPIRVAMFSEDEIDAAFAYAESISNGVVHWNSDPWRRGDIAVWGEWVREEVSNG